MGLLEKIFPKKERERQMYEETYFKGLTLYEPRFTTWGGAVYESELVRSSIDAIARRFAKMNVKMEGSAKPTMQRRSAIIQTAGRPGRSSCTEWRPSCTFRTTASSFQC